MAIVHGLGGPTYVFCIGNTAMNDWHKAKCNGGTKKPVAASRAHTQSNIVMTVNFPPPTHSSCGTPQHTTPRRCSGCYCNRYVILLQLLIHFIHMCATSQSCGFGTIVCFDHACEFTCLVLCDTHTRMHTQMGKRFCIQSTINQQRCLPTPTATEKTFAVSFGG